MKYKMIIVVSGDEISACDVRDAEELDNINIDGNMTKSYSDENGIDEFVTALKDYYNIDEFNDLDMTLVLINSGAERAMLDKLYARLSLCKNISVLDAKTVLTYVLAVKRKLINQDKIYASLLNQKYMISYVKDSGTYECTETEDEAEYEKLDVKDFTIFYYLDRRVFSNEEEIQKIIREYDEKIDAMMKTANSEQKRLKTKLDEEKTRADQAEKKLKKLEARYKKETDEKQTNEGRAIIRFKR